MLGHWHRLPKEDAAAPSLELLKTRLDEGLEQPGLVKNVLSMAGGLELNGHFSSLPTQTILQFLATNPPGL